MKEFQIPFGLHLESNQLVDVSDVPRGNLCGCICPSCRTPLTARKADVNQWHFAHRSKSVHNDTEHECEYSFAVSVRLMIRQLATESLRFRTPSYSKNLPPYDSISQIYPERYLITNERSIDVTNLEIGAVFSNATVDILGCAANIPIAIYITYKGRKLPKELMPPTVERSGVIEINLNTVSAAFKEEKEGRYMEILRNFIEHGTAGKSWVYHPRENSCRKQAEEQRDLQLSKRSLPPGLSLTPNRDTQRLGLFGQLKSQNLETRNYKCFACNSQWVGTSRHCEKCNSAISTRP